VTATSGRNGAGVGEELAAANGTVTLSIRVTSPAWIPVEEVRVLVNGAVVERFDAGTKPRVRPVPSDFASSGKTMRFKAKRKLSLSADAWVLVEAGVAIPDGEVPVPAAPEPMNRVVEGVLPYAATNPIFVDVGADGYTAPGLGAAALARGRTGRMTGVTRADRDAAIAEGEYLPLWAIRLPAAVDLASTTTTTTTCPCPTYTSTTLGAPDCGGSGGSCFGFCGNARACVPDEHGTCGCTGDPLPCGIVSAGGACGGECPDGGTCQYWPSPLPGPCPGPPVCGCFPPP
jgi:hypothetical protein